jgi:hypothetical protein
MAPLVPYMISPEFDLVLALLLGVGFGFALEQAGFSSTRKLVGLFYGYDFTVLKVFFTAGVTAMTGVLFLGHFGALDLQAIYVNPTFLWSALIGGFIMGIGFIIGGFCPGTSLCAAAVGRIDAMFFIGGSVIGILMFTEFYSWLEPLFTAGYLGSPLVGDMLGISPPVFALLLTAVAIIAFMGTSWIQDKVRGEITRRSPARIRSYTIAGLVPVVLILAVILLPSRNDFILQKVEDEYTLPRENVRSMGIDQLAYELINNAHSYNVIHVFRNEESSADAGEMRAQAVAISIDTQTETTEEIAYSSIPTEIRVPYHDLLDPRYREIIRQRYKINLFVSEDSNLARRAATMAAILGSQRSIWFDHSVSEFRQAIFEPPLIDPNATKQELDRERFRRMASERLLQMEERLKNLSKPIIREPVRASGGC